MGSSDLISPGYRRWTKNEVVIVIFPYQVLKKLYVSGIRMKKTKKIKKYF